MTDRSDAFPDRSAPFPRRADELDEEARVREHAVARAWLWAQEEELSEVFLAEGRSDLPVEDYAAWRQGQQHRLGNARVQWQATLREAGWRLGGTGSRSLAYLRPDLMDEYDFDHEDNPADLPYKGTLTSTLSVWWCCSRDERHRWRTSISNRHAVGTGCPRCAKRGVSRREQDIFTALKDTLPDLTSPGVVPRTAAGEGTRQQRAWRVDMYLPGAPPVVVEYDGAYWHKDRFQQDAAKTADLSASGHLVIRIREHPLEVVTPNDIECPADLPAAEVAAQVRGRMTELTQSGGSAAPQQTKEQLDLFPASHLPSPGEAHNADQVAGASERKLLAACSRQALLAVHRADVLGDGYARSLGDGAHLSIAHTAGLVMRELGAAEALLRVMMGDRALPRDATRSSPHSLAP
ncbi:zinc-ribbon domain-containing protein [Streptomyces sp. MB09-01]|uniref:zinc-ribbon domain-containing protein n=1 Tax=Streptomyces sp. MB09-01 TaxID=3028666 RepID=UPI0029A7684F|nr:zinc-ribbon domain-containing protein [Streptomyces sp. MB09-01]MDX3540445.1 zinc-ribbon domain-containing protein [Streptomyces sp. MB09-01]